MQKLSIYFVCVALFAVFSYAAAQEASGIGRDEYSLWFVLTSCFCYFILLFAVFFFVWNITADMCIPACLASPSDFGLTDCDPSVSEADCELSNGDQCQSLCQLLFSTAPNGMIMSCAAVFVAASRCFSLIFFCTAAECGACHSALRSACAAEHKSKKKKKEIVEIFKQLLCAADNAGGHACTDCQD